MSRTEVWAVFNGGASNRVDTLVRCGYRSHCTLSAKMWRRRIIFPGIEPNSISVEVVDRGTSPIRCYIARMITGPLIAEIAGLVGEPARATMLSALLDGRSLTATELAYAARVTPQTASTH